MIIKNKYDKIFFTYLVLFDLFDKIILLLFLDTTTLHSSIPNTNSKRKNNF